MIPTVKEPKELPKCTPKMSKLSYSESRYKLFQFFDQAHGILLLDSEINDVINAVMEYIKEQEGATTEATK